MWVSHSPRSYLAVLPCLWQVLWSQLPCTARCASTPQGFSSQMVFGTILLAAAKQKYQIPCCSSGSQLCHSALFRPLPSFLLFPSPFPNSFPIFPIFSPFLAGIFDFLPRAPAVFPPRLRPFSFPDRVRAGFRLRRQRCSMSHLIFHRDSL